MISAEFLATAFLVVLIPGTGVVFTITTGISSGWRGGMAAAVGCTLGIIPHLAASILGLSALMHMSALAFQILKYAGAAYLLYLAWNMWRDNQQLSFSAKRSRLSAGTVILRAFLINILNPKLTIFFLSFLPHFIRAEQGQPELQLLLLSAVFMLLTLLVFLAYGFLANGVRTWFTRSERAAGTLRKSFALLIGFFGLKLAFADR